MRSCDVPEGLPISRNRNSCLFLLLSPTLIVGRRWHVWVWWTYVCRIWSNLEFPKHANYSIEGWWLACHHSQPFQIRPDLPLLLPSIRISCQQRILHPTTVFLTPTTMYLPQIKPLPYHFLHLHTIIALMVFKKHNEVNYNCNRSTYKGVHTGDKGRIYLS